MDVRLLCMKLYIKIMKQLSPPPIPPPPPPNNAKRGDKSHMHLTAMKLKEIETNFRL